MQAHTGNKIGTVIDSDESYTVIKWPIRTHSGIHTFTVAGYTSQELERYNIQLREDKA